ncbi:MAG TPA: mobile mystery protein A [Magnetospirillaceae bacterium]|jgi:predicted DNA-binding mobile mystery protein A
MDISHSAAQSRQGLDARYRNTRSIEDLKLPAQGWIKAIRKALSMSSLQLARRLGVKQPTLVAFEQSELKGTIQLSTLRRIAEAMDCTLVYALVPRESLETTYLTQARKVARRRLQSVAHTMALENQAVPDKSFEARIDAIVRDMNPRAIWNEL